MKHSIYFKSFLATALIVFISFSLLGALSSAWNYRRSLSDKRSMMASTLHEMARFVTAQHVYYGVDLSDLNLSMWLSVTSGVSGFDLMITDTDGVVGACSDRELMHFGRRVPEDALLAAGAYGYDARMTTLGDVYSERRLVVGAPLTMSISGEVYVFGYLFVSSDMAAFSQQWRNFSEVFILIALGVMVLTYVISFMTTKKQTKPLNEMALAARKFARGDFSVRVDDTGRQDEIGHLTEAFNAMADSLESSENFRRDFIANISHELKTPMTVISGFAEGLLDGTIPRENEARYLKVISSETRRLSRLVKGMLEMSSIQATSFESKLDSNFDVSEVVRIALLSLDAKIEEKQLGVEANLPEEPIITRGDSDAITQVVYNLIDNAIKFSDSVGVIKLEIWKEGAQAFVAVENRGETIEEDELPNIFDRFHKADKSRSADREGVGLGLYIVKIILDNHHENIFVTSRDGVTRFMFTLTIA